MLGTPAEVWKAPEANIIPYRLQCRPMSQSGPSTFNSEEVTLYRF